jgi:drug/metabolite transporter (DMT)-like permease
MGLGAALGQAVGLFFSKRGMLLGVAPLEANQVRLLAGASVIVLWGLVRGHLRGDRQKLTGRRRWWLIAGGTVFGPILGVLFSLLAVKYAHMALAATLMGLTPVMMLPVMRIVFGERFTPPAVIGTFIAVLGAALLFWV